MKMQCFKGSCCSGIDYLFLYASENLRCRTRRLLLNLWFKWETSLAENSVPLNSQGSWINANQLCRIPFVYVEPRDYASKRTPQENNLSNIRAGVCYTYIVQ
jgi:hypothetical protein